MDRVEEAGFPSRKTGLSSQKVLIHFIHLRGNLVEHSCDERTV